MKLPAFMQTLPAIDRDALRARLDFHHAARLGSGRPVTTAVQRTLVQSVSTYVLETCVQLLSTLL